MLTRAYSILEIKAIDDDQRIIEGIASTPETDRVGDIMDPLGAEFSLPLPFLWQHDRKQPIGEVYWAQPGKNGIPIKARVAKVDEPGTLKDRLDEAWQSIKAKLVRGLSIGFDPMAADPIAGTFGYFFKKWAWLELSAVTIPANASASIQIIKSLDAPFLAASGEGQGPSVDPPGVSGPLAERPAVRVSAGKSRSIMSQKKSLAEQIASLEATRQVKADELAAVQQKATDEGRTKDTTEREAFDALKVEIKGIDDEIADLKELETLNKAAAAPIAGGAPAAAAASRGAMPPAAGYVRVQPNEEPGIGFAKAVLCKAAAFLAQGAASPLDIAKARYPDNDRVHAYLKATIPAGTTTGVTWAAPFIDPTNLGSEFIDFLRPDTILGKFGTNGIPSLRRVPFNVRILGQTSGGDAYWVAEGAPKPVTKFDFNAQTLPFHKVATIAIITKELARFSVPSAERIVRDSLAKAVTGRIDADLLDPAQAAVSGVNPASLTNGLTALAPSGTSADAARADIARVVKEYLDENNSVANLVLVMPASLALSLSVMRNALGGREFSDLGIRGGSLEGIPVITSQYVANQSGGGNLVVAINADDVLLADDGNVTVDVSNQASLQMLDNPTNSAATGTATQLVSLWQTNSIGLLAEREITWSKARATAVVYMDDVNWGSIGSPG